MIKNTELDTTNFCSVEFCVTWDCEICGIDHGRSDSHWIFYKSGDLYAGNFEKDQGLVLSSIQDGKCEKIGRFNNIKERDGTKTTILVEGKTICSSVGKDKTEPIIRIGTINPLCSKKGAWGGPFYSQNQSFIFWGTLNVTCDNFGHGIKIEKSTGKAYAVKLDENGDMLEILKEVNLNKIMKEHSLN